MNESQKSLLRELFICSINELEISPESNSVQTLHLKSLCEACTKKCQSLHSVEVGHYMEEEEVPRVSSRQRCLCTHKKIMLFAGFFLFVFSEWKFDLSLLSSTEVSHSRQCRTMFLIKLPYIYYIADLVKC